jgi:hypothetical protein
MPLQRSTGGSTGFSRTLRIPSFLWGSRSSSIGARGVGPSHSTTLPRPGELLLLPAPLLQCPASSLLLLRPLPLPQGAHREGASHRRGELRSTRRRSSFAPHAACLLVSSVTGSSGRPDLEARSAAAGSMGDYRLVPRPCRRYSGPWSCFSTPQLARRERRRSAAPRGGARRSRPCAFRHTPCRQCDNPPRKIPYYHLNQSTLVIKR